MMVRLVRERAGQVGAGCAPASAVVLGELVVTAACLINAVEIWVAGDACLIHRLEKDVIHGAFVAYLLYMQWAIRPVHLVFVDLLALCFFVVRQYIFQDQPFAPACSQAAKSTGTPRT